MSEYARRRRASAPLRRFLGQLVPSGVSCPKYDEVWSQARLQTPPPDDKGTQPSQGPSRPRESGSSAHGGQNTPTKGGCSSNRGPQDPWLLQPHFLGSQEERVLETSDRPVSSQQILSGTPLQDGDDTVCGNSDTTRRLGCIPGSQGCIFSHPDPPGLPTLPPFLLRGSSVPISGSTVRPSHGTPDFHHGSQSLRRPASCVGFKSSLLPRRLAPTLPLQGATSKSAGLPHREGDPGGLDNKRRKVRDDTVSRLCLHRHPIYDLVGSDAPSHRQNMQDIIFHSSVEAEDLGFCKGVAAASRVIKLSSGSDPHGKVIHAASPTSPPVTVAPPCGRPDSQDQGSPGSFGASLEVLGVGDESPEGCGTTPPPTELSLFTDASLSGWGAHLDRGDSSIKGVWTVEESKFPINHLEMMTVILAVRAYLPKFRGKRVSLFCDNATVVAYIRKQGGTRSGALCRMTWELLQFCAQEGIVLVPRHIPGRRNILADQLSRMGKLVQTEWTLHMDVVSQLCLLWDSPTVDLFATRLNKRLPLYISPLPDEDALEVDSLAASWDGLNAYAYPPISLIQHVLNKVSTSQVRVILIAPCWPNQAWFPVLLELLTDLPRRIPNWERLLWHPIGRVYHQTPSFYNLHAWRLSGMASEREAFQRRLSDRCLNLKGSLPLHSTRVSGLSTRIGVVRTEYIRSLPLFPN